MLTHAPRSSTTKKRALCMDERGTLGALAKRIVDRGLAVVLTMVLGAASFAVEAACGPDTEHPPVTEDLGNDPASNNSGNTGTAGEQQATGGSNSTGGDNSTSPNGLLPPDQTTPTNPGAGNGTSSSSSGAVNTSSSSGVITTTPTQPTLDGG